MMTLIVLVLCLRSIAAASTGPLEYTIDPAQSTFRVRTGSSGLFKAFGHDHTIAIRDFSGRLQLTPEAMTPASLELAVEANSLVVVGDEKDAAKIERDMRQTVLEVATYPQIRFHSTSIVLTNRSADQIKVTITGDLTLHGVTREVRLAADATVTAERVRAQGRFSLRQTDYKIKPFSVAGGTVRVKDQIELTFDIIARATLPMPMPLPMPSPFMRRVSLRVQTAPGQYAAPVAAAHAAPWMRQPTDP